MKKTAYVLLKDEKFFIGASFDKEESIVNSKKIDNCKVIESSAVQNQDGSFNLLDLEFNKDGTVSIIKTEVH